MNTVLRKAILLTVVSSTVLLSSCATSPLNNEVKEGLALNEQGMNALKLRQQGLMQAPTHNDVVNSSLPWVDIVPIARRDSLPADIFNLKASLNEPYETSVDRVIYKLSRIIGLPVNIERDVLDTGTNTAGAGAGAGSSTNTDSTGETISVGGDTSSAATKGFSEVKITVSHSGTVTTLLNSVAAALQSQWRYNSDLNSVTFYRYETGEFRYIALPGGSSIQSSLQTGSDSGGASNVSFTDNTNIWDSIKDDLDAKLSKDGKYSINQKTGLIIIRDLPRIVKEVGLLIDHHNKLARRQVIFDVKVYSVIHNKTDSRGVDWNAVLTSGSGSNSAGFSVGGLTNTGGIGTFVLNSLGGSSVGSQLLLNNLSTVGVTSTVTNTVLRTIHNQPIPFASERTKGYLKSVSSSTNATTGAVQVSREPGEIIVGYSIQLLPSIQENGRDILTQVAMSFSSLEGLETFGAGGDAIHLPETNNRNFLQRIWLRSGQSLVLTGYENIVTGTTDKGLFSAKNWGFGGSSEANKRVESLIIVITPRVQDVTDAFDTKIR